MVEEGSSLGTTMAVEEDSRPGTTMVGEEGEGSSPGTTGTISRTGRTTDRCLCRLADDLVSHPIQSGQFALGPLELLILQPTPFCNLDCDYCYLPNRTAKDRMPLALVDTIATRVAESGLLSDQVTVVWHAGEPLVLPVAYYESAVDALAARLPPSVSVRHAFQTNAILIQDDWCRFFGRPGITVGVSVDGPAPLHDVHRKTRSGKGTLEATVAGMDRLRERAIPFDVITVLTHDSLEYPDELFDFYLDHRIDRVGFNIEELEGENAASSLSSTDSVALFKRFLRRFLMLCAADGWPIRIREFDQLLSMAGTRVNPTRNQQVMPFSIVTVGWNGDVSTFSPELIGFSTKRYPTFVIGNIRDQPFDEMATGAVLQALKSDIDAGINQCRQDCPYFEYCGGGVPANKVFENGNLASGETMYCRLMRKAIIDVAIECSECFSGFSGAGDGRQCLC